jgi:signal transduction histidine kinase
MDLRAALLDDQDLAAALESGVCMWTAGTGINASVNATHPSGPLSKDVEQDVFRIAQEAVTNVVKHAGAKKIAVNLDIQPRKLNLTIADDGCGFDEGQAFASARGHFGLLGMRERAKRMRGELRLESKAGRGTTVEVEVPLG